MEKQGRRDSNPQPPVLETGALPIELLPLGVLARRTTLGSSPGGGQSAFADPAAVPGRGADSCQAGAGGCDQPDDRARRAATDGRNRVGGRAGSDPPMRAGPPRPRNLDELVDGGPSTGDSRVVRGTGQAHQRRHLHPGPAPRLRRRRRPRRGAGGLPAGLPVHRQVPGRRPVLHLALPHHRQLRLDPPRATAPAPTRRARRGGRRARHQARARPGHRRRRRRSCASQLEAAIAELPPRLRAVVVLRDIYDLSHAEIADAARHLRIRGQGAPAPGPPPAAHPGLPAGRRGHPPRSPRSTPVRSERLRDRATTSRPRARPSPTCSPAWSTAPPASTAPSDATSSAACAARPSWPSTASCSEPCRASGPPPSPPPPGWSPTCSRTSRPPASAAPSAPRSPDARSPTSAASPPRPRPPGAGAAIVLVSRGRKGRLPLAG